MARRVGQLLVAVAVLGARAALSQEPPTDDAGAALASDAGVLSPEDQALLRELAATTPAPRPPATVSPFSNLYNPAISVNGLLLGTAATDPATGAQVGLTVQELELQLSANVDPYFSANVTLSVPGLSGVEVEEGYLAVLPQPLGLAVRGGKMRVPFGRENPLHTHALPFVDRSLVGSDVFGEEGLSEVGLEGTWLAPLPWYSLVTLAGLDGRNEGLFDSPSGRDLAGVAALKNVFDLTDDATLEAGASYTAGNNQDRRLAQALGAHLVFKWRPAREATSSSFMATVEGIISRRPSDTVREAPPPFETGGLYGAVQWQLARRWYVGARIEFLAHRGVEEEVTLKQSAVLVFAPTEFSAFRLQGNALEPPGGAPVIIEGFLQVNFTIGAHPAHAY